jgi:NADPH2:quinone reductase
MKSGLSIRITVCEHLSERLATAFDGLTLMRCSGATALVGEVVDQAQLHGLLTRICDLGLTLQSVTVFDATPPPARPKGAAVSRLVYSSLNSQPTQRNPLMNPSTNEPETMRRVIVDRHGGPEVLKVIEEDIPRPAEGEVRVRVLAAGVSFTDSQLRAGTYIPGGPKPPFTPGYELVGIVEELGAGCSRLRKGDRIGALTVWGADADRVCLPEAGAVKVPEDLDPAEVLSLVFTYMTSYQVLHRIANAKRGETVLVHGAAGRVGKAALELGAAAGLRLYGTCSARDRAAVERLSAVAIDYRNEDFLARVRELTGGEGVDVVVDSLGGPISLKSFRTLRPGGRLVVFGRYDTLKDGHKDWPAVIKWYTSVAAVWAWGKLSPRRQALKYQIQRFRAHSQRRAGAAGGEPRHPEWFQEDFHALLALLREGNIHPVVAERLPLSEARHAHELLDSAAAKGKLVLVP